MRHGWRRGTRLGRRIRELFEELRHRRCQSAGGGSCDGRRISANRECLHQSRFVLGRSKVEDQKWKIKSGRSKVEDQKWKIKSGRSKVEDQKWKEDLRGVSR